MISHFLSGRHTEVPGRIGTTRQANCDVDTHRSGVWTSWNVLYDNETLRALTQGTGRFMAMWREAL